ncbi:MAG: hypothetical protein MUC69_03885 [Gemmatimonadales bacterium]|jgi:folate-binding protein YgfZ|nr:hypothetical protein [Gemmatimonadales bacterium]
MAPAETRIDPAQFATLTDGAVVVETSPAVFRLDGPGARDCLQGLLTNDVAGADDRLIYGALLTPKGMIVADYWVFRVGGIFHLLADRAAHAPSLELFRRQIPPRLARVTDLSDEWSALHLIGRGSLAALARVTPDAAELEHGAARAAREGELLLGRGSPAAPFAALCAGPSRVVREHATRLCTAGATLGGERDVEASRILAGWPRLGAEIDERTLPQEVRYDEIGGVSYTKGCYVGQETVARLHFRGHTNRDLRGLEWNDDGALDHDEIRRGEKVVGTVRSTMLFDGRRVGLGLVRREVEPGAEVVAGGRPARVVSLPLPG